LSSNGEYVQYLILFQGEIFVRSWAKAKIKELTDSTDGDRFETTHKNSSLQKLDLERKAQLN
jgi:hypothetical protein